MLTSGFAGEASPLNSLRVHRDALFIQLIYGYSDNFEDFNIKHQKIITVSKSTVMVSKHLEVVKLFASTCFIRTEASSAPLGLMVMLYHRGEQGAVR